MNIKEALEKRLNILKGSLDTDTFSSTNTRIGLFTLLLTAIENTDTNDISTALNKAGLSDPAVDVSTATVPVLTKALLAIVPAFIEKNKDKKTSVLNDDLQRVLRTVVKRQCREYEMKFSDKAFDNYWPVGTMPDQVKDSIRKVAGACVTSVVSKACLNEKLSDKELEVLNPCFFGSIDDWGILLDSINKEIAKPKLDANQVVKLAETFSCYAPYWFMYQMRQDPAANAAFIQYAVTDIKDKLNEISYEVTGTCDYHTIASRNGLNKNATPKDAFEKTTNWPSVINDYYFKRDVFYAVFEEVKECLDNKNNTNAIITISSPSGRGKSVLLRQLAHACATELHAKVVYSPGSCNLKPISIKEDTIYILDSAYSVREISQWKNALKENNSLVIAAAQDVAWNQNEDCFLKFADKKFNIDRMNGDEQVRLSKKLGEAYGEKWTGKTQRERDKILSDPGELIIAVIVAATGQRLDDYVRGELTQFLKDKRIAIDNYSKNPFVFATLLVALYDMGDLSIHKDELEKLLLVVDDLGYLPNMYQALKGIIFEQEDGTLKTRHRKFAQEIIACWGVKDTTEPLPKANNSFAKVIELVDNDILGSTSFAREPHSSDKAVINEFFNQQEGDKKVLIEVAFAIGWLGDASLIPLLKEVFNQANGDKDVLSNFAFAIGKIGHASLFPLLEEVFSQTEGEIDVLKEVAFAIGMIGDASLIPLLKEVFNQANGDKDVLSNVAFAIGKIGDASLSSLLEEVFNQAEGDRLVLMVVARAIGEIGDASSSLLEEVFNQAEGDRLVLSDIALAIERIGDSSLCSLLNKVFNQAEDDKEFLSEIAWDCCFFGVSKTKTLMERVLKHVGEKLDKIKLLKELYKYEEAYPQESKDWLRDQFIALGVNPDKLDAEED